MPKVRRSYVGVLTLFLLSAACATTRPPVTAAHVVAPTAPPGPVATAAPPAAITEATDGEAPSREVALNDVRSYAREALAAGADDPRAEARIIPAIRRWARWSQAMIDDGRRADADALFEAIAEANATLRDANINIRPRGLHRETFLFESLRVEVWEWSEPVRYYPNSDMMWRWITYNLLEGEERVARIDLEMSNFAGPHFVLGGASARGHAQYVTYGPQHPGSAQVREDAMRVLRGEVDAIISSRRGQIRVPVQTPAQGQPSLH